MINGTNRAYRRLFATSDGQQVLKHLIQTYGDFTASAYVEGSPERTIYQLGQADLVKDVLRRLSVDLEAIKEATRLAHQPAQDNA